MADITVSASVKAGLSLSRSGGSAHMGGFITDQTGYTFHINGSGDFVYRKSADGGQTWGSEVSIGTAAAIGAYGPSVWFEKWTPGNTGTKFLIAYADSVAGNVKFRSLDTSTDTLSSAVVVKATDIGTDDSTTTQIIVDNGGYYFVSYGGWGGSTIAGFCRSVDNGANWTDRTSPFEGDDQDPPGCILLPANLADTHDVWMIYGDFSANQFSLKTYDDSANSWSETAISPASGGYFWLQDARTDARGSAAAIRHSDGHIIWAAHREWDHPNDELDIFDINGSGSITHKGSISLSDDAAGNDVFIDQNTGDLYVFWLGKADGSETYQATVHVYYSKSTNGGTTWGTPVLYDQGTSDDYRAVWTGHSTPGNASGRVGAFWYDDDDFDLFFNYTNSIAITVGGGGTPVALAGAVGSLSAIITKKGLKPLAGAHSMAATVAKKAITSKSGAVGAITGVATKQVTQSFAGAISVLSATVTWLPIKYLTGSISSSATIVKATAKKLSGISGSIAATTSKKTLKPLAGIAGGLSATITPVKVAILSLAGTMGALSGDIVKRVLKPLAGPVSVSGNVIKSTLKALSGVTGLAGTIVKMTARALSGATGGLTAALAGAKLVAIALAGATGSLSATVTKSTLRPLGGTITSAGEMVRKTIKSITGAAGALTAVLTPELVGGLYQVVGGAITASGTVAKLTKTTLSGAYSMAAELYKGMVAAFSGNFSATGEISKRITVVRTGVMGAVSGTVARATTFVLIASGSIATLTSSIQRLINKSLSGAITNIFAFAGKPYKLAFSGAFTLSGFMQFNSVTRRAKMKAGLVVKSVTSMIAGRTKR